jgi:hypothetical protein
MLNSVVHDLDTCRTPRGDPDGKGHSVLSRQMLTPLDPELIAEPEDAPPEETLAASPSRFREDERREAERFLGFENGTPAHAAKPPSG